jgi:hypothetical protein
MKPTFRTFAPVASVVAFAIARTIVAADSGARQESTTSSLQQAESLRFFEAKIRPVLVSNCYRCHSADSGKSRGGLRLDSREAMLRGGDSGPAIVPGSPEESLIFRAICYVDDELRMPPSAKLPEDVIADLRRWIEMGAPDSRTSERVKSSDRATHATDIQAGRTYWAYQPLARASVPTVRDAAWPRSDIDRFILAGLERQALAPVRDADASVLVRRLFLVLVGLPPSPEEAARWTSMIERATDDKLRRRAIEGLVDTLLDSPRFGERWGRHWLDVARFAESTGGDHNNIYQHAWRYRDYVIHAFNSDKPFDQFIREQIAGDLLPTKSDADWAENVIATGFLAIGAKNVGAEDQEQFFADLVDEQIDATSRAFLATTASCARCHDHKFDPIPQSDYYAMAAIFRSTKTHYGLLSAQARQSTSLLDLTGLGPPAARDRASTEELRKLTEARDQARAELNDAMSRIRSGEEVFRGALRRLRSQRDETEAALQAFDARGNPRVFAMGVQDHDTPMSTYLLIRGDLDRRAEQTPRGVLSVLAPPGRAAFPNSQPGSGRVRLANWIASNDNPLTARVAANRIWHWMFGRGVVESVDDFGRAGVEPSNPELLDYLASILVQRNWSMKALIREIALSRTWQLSSEGTSSSLRENEREDERESTGDQKSNAELNDPDNRLLWRWMPRRLEAEAIRDAMLAASARLDLNPPLGTYLSVVGEGGVGQNVFEPVIRAIAPNTRSVYLPRVRSALHESLVLFDAPDASLVMGAREETQSPLQALYLMNSEFVQSQAIGLAERIGQAQPSVQVHRAYEILFARSPTAAELELGLRFLTNNANGTRQRTDASSMSPLARYCQGLLSTAEFQMIQ